MITDPRSPSKIEISLQPDLEKFVAEKVRAGQYADTSELVCELLRVLRDHDDALMPTDPAGLADLRRRIAVGVEQLDRGEGVELDGDSLDAFFDDVAQRGRKRMQSKRLLE